MASLNNEEHVCNESEDVGSLDKPRKETVSEKRLNVRRTIEHYLEEKRQKHQYGFIEEYDE